MISLRGLSIDLPGFTLESLDLAIGRNEFFMIVGPSGAGKTLMLEAIAGLQDISEGEIWVDNRNVTSMPPEKRNIALVYQDYALFPHLTVNENILYGLRFCDDRDLNYVKHLNSLLKIGDLLSRDPSTLSGGEKQRVALARALAVKPGLLLLDEPLSALDPSFREEIQEYLKKLHSEGITIVMVTHDFGEVLSLGNRVAVLKEGILRQVGYVSEVFKSPADPVVADFVGMKNLIPCDFKANKAISPDGLTFTLYHPDPRGCSFLGIRPEDISIARMSREDKDRCNSFRGEVTSIMSRGTVIEVVVTVGNFRFFSYMLASTLVDMKLQLGEQVCLKIKPEMIHAL